MAPPRAATPPEVEAALRTLELADRTLLNACAAAHRLRQLAKTSSTRKQAQAFDASLKSPRRLARIEASTRGSKLFVVDLTFSLVVRHLDVEDVGRLGSACCLAKVRVREALCEWKALRRKLHTATIDDVEAALRGAQKSSPRYMYWTLCRLSRMGAVGVAYEHGRRLKLAQQLAFSQQRVTKLTELCRLAEKREIALYGPHAFITCPPKLVRFLNGNFSMCHVNFERVDVHNWARHSSSKYWMSVWDLLSHGVCEFTKVRHDRSRYLLERFIFPFSAEEWIAVTQVTAAQRHHSPLHDSHQVELRCISGTMYLKVKPPNQRHDDSLDVPPDIFRRAKLAPFWLKERVLVPILAMF